MTMPSMDALRDLTPAYVMGTLTPEELHAFEAALRDPTIAAALAPEIADHQRTVASLAASQAVAAPPAIRERLLQRIAADRHPAREAGVLSFPVPPRAVDAPPVPASGSAWKWTGVLATALAASLVFAVSMRRERDQLQVALGEQRQKLAQTAAALAQRNATMEILTESGSNVRLIQLVANTNAGPGMQVFWNVRTGAAVVHASGLAPIAKNRSYCLWMIRGGVPVALALFTPDADGRRLINVSSFPTSVENVAALAVTEEPAEGSPAPTMKPFLVGAVSPK